MFRRSLPVLLLAGIVAVVLVADPGHGQDADVKRVTAVVEKVERDAILELDGRLHALERDEIAIRPRVYRGAWVLRSVVEPGTLVKAGQVVAELETRDLEATLERARLDLATADTGFRHKQVQAEMSRAATADDMKRRGRDLEEARRRLTAWVEHRHPFAIEDDRLSHESWKMSVDNAKEELAELEKMYGEDELVEATEELVLKRSRRSLAHRIASYELNRRKRAVHVEYEESRTKDRLEFDLTTKERAHERQVATVEMGERDRRLGLERAKLDVEDRGRHLRNVEHDLEIRAVRAPRDGVLFHAADPAAVTRLRPGRRIGAGQPFLWVVRLDELTLRFQAPAKRLLDLKPGLQLRFTPKVDGAGAVLGEVTRVGSFVSSDQKVSLEGRLRDSEDSTPGVVGGVAGRVGLHTGREEVLVVPEAAIAKKDGKTTCTVVVDGKDEVRAVKTGRTADGKTAVLEGLEEGDTVVLIGGGR